MHGKSNAKTHEHYFAEGDEDVLRELIRATAPASGPA
jgi:hypothetical protein